MMLRRLVAFNLSTTRRALQASCVISSRCNGTQRGTAVNSPVDRADLRRSLEESIEAGDVEAAQQIAALMARRNTTAAATGKTPSTQASQSDPQPGPIFTPNVSAPQASPVAVELPAIDAPKPERARALVTLLDTSFVDTWAVVDEGSEQDADASCARLLNLFQTMRRDAWRNQIDAITAVLQEAIDDVVSTALPTPRHVDRAALHRASTKLVESNVAVRVNVLLQSPQCSVIDIEKQLQDFGVVPTKELAEEVKHRLRDARAVAMGRGRLTPKRPASPELELVPTLLERFVEECVVFGAPSVDQLRAIEETATRVARRVAGEAESSPTFAQALQEARRILIAQCAVDNRIKASSDPALAPDTAAELPSVMRYDIGMHETVADQLAPFLKSSSDEPRDDMRKHADALASKCCANAVDTLNAKARVAEAELYRRIVTSQPAKRGPDMATTTAAAGPLTAAVLAHRNEGEKAGSETGRRVSDVWLTRPVVPFALLLRYRLTFHTEQE